MPVIAWFMLLDSVSCFRLLRYELSCSFKLYNFLTGGEAYDYVRKLQTPIEMLYFPKPAAAYTSGKMQLKSWSLGYDFYRGTAAIMSNAHAVQKWKTGVTPSAASASATFHSYSM